MWVGAQVLLDHESELLADRSVFWHPFDALPGVPHAPHVHLVLAPLDPDVARAVASERLDIFDDALDVVVRLPVDVPSVSRALMCALH
eukprot:4701838-Pyramimonas_sp.AAC.1